MNAGDTGSVQDLQPRATTRPRAFSVPADAVCNVTVTSTYTTSTFKVRALEEDLLGGQTITGRMISTLQPWPELRRASINRVAMAGCVARGYRDVSCM